MNSPSKSLDQADVQTELTADASQPKDLDPYDSYHDETAKHVLRILGQTNGQPNSEFCHRVEAFRTRTGYFPLPLEQLPCRNCEMREGID